jgi:signal transduction histidine kinase
MLRWKRRLEMPQRAEEMMAGIEVALHDLCQPLTVLQCKLELGLLQGGEEAIHSAVVDGLRECRRLNAVVKTMRELVEGPELEGTR